METAKFEDIGNLTQIQYNKLIGMLAEALGTWRKYIEPLGKKQLQDNVVVYRVKSRGYRYHLAFKNNILIWTAREV